MYLPEFIIKCFTFKTTFNMCIKYRAVVAQGVNQSKVLLHQSPVGPQWVQTPTSPSKQKIRVSFVRSSGSNGGYEYEGSVVRLQSENIDCIEQRTRILVGQVRRTKRSMVHLLSCGMAQFVNHGSKQVPYLMYLSWQ